MNKLTQLLTDLFTAKNGIDYSLTKLIGLSAGVAMIYNFVAAESGDYSGFGTGIGLIMAALAAKYLAEAK